MTCDSVKEKRQAMLLKGENICLLIGLLIKGHSASKGVYTTRTDILINARVLDQPLSQIKEQINELQ